MSVLPGAPALLAFAILTACSDGGSAAPMSASANSPLEIDAGSPPPSCAASGPGLSNCGANKESCCASTLVTGGTYYRTYTNNGGGPVAQADPATVSTFRLDKYSVTVGRFRQFSKAWAVDGWFPAAGSGKHTHLNGGQGLVNVAAAGAAGPVYEPGWAEGDLAFVGLTTAFLLTCNPYSTWTDKPGSQENLPINCVDWPDAYAFCIWDGGFLPSEAEWEYAAAGGSQQREYPWGSAAPGAGNQYAIYGCDYPVPTSTGLCSTVLNIAPVGTAKQGAGFWGQLDLAGDVWQWGLDSYSPYAACKDCVSVTAGSDRVVRGGYFGTAPSRLLPPYRNSAPPTSRISNLGFRCARSP